MFELDKEVAALAQQPTAERVKALKRIIPCVTIKSILKKTKQSRSCARFPKWFMVWFVVGMGLFCRRPLPADFSLSDPISFQAQTVAVHLVRSETALGSSATVLADERRGAAAGHDQDSRRLLSQSAVDGRGRLRTRCARYGRQRPRHTCASSQSAGTPQENQRVCPVEETSGRRVLEQTVSVVPPSPHEPRRSGIFALRTALAFGRLNPVQKWAGRLISSFSNPHLKIIRVLMMKFPRETGPWVFDSLAR